MSEPVRFNIKFIGDTNSGKTSVIKRFYFNSFTPSETTTIRPDLYTKIITALDSPVELQTTDTAGQERYRAITFQYYRNADAVFFVYDIAERQSFLNISEHWIDDVNRVIDSSTLKYLLANKSDVTADKRCVLSHEGEETAKNLNMTFFEISAKTSDNIEAAFMHCATRLHQLRLHSQCGNFDELTAQELASVPSTTNIKYTKKKKKSLCCTKQSPDI